MVRRIPGRLSLVVLGLMLACGGPQIDQLVPLLVVSPETPNDGLGHYVLDFGTVGVGTTTSLNLNLQNQGRAVLTLQPLQIDAPFSSDLTTQVRVAISGNYTIDFAFAPTAVGPFETTVVLTSDGGKATIILKGVASTSPPPPACSFMVSPTTMNFGTLTVNTSKTSSFTITNTGTMDCQVSVLALTATTDPAFTLPMPPAIPATVNASSSLTVDVTFAPTRVASLFTGDVSISIGPPGGAAAVGKLVLEGSSLAGPPPPSCTFKVTPTNIAFGVVNTGSSKNGAFDVTNTSTVDCTVSELKLSPTSSSAFALPALPALPFTLGPMMSEPVKVTFTPQQAAMSYTGEVNLLVGPAGIAGAAANVTLSGSTPMPIPPATAPIYLNDMSTLYSFDTTNNTFKTIGDFSDSQGDFFSMYDIAINATGVMAGVSSGIIYLINPNTAACTESVTSPDSLANGLTFTPSGDLVVAGSAVNLYNMTTGQFSTLVQGGQYQTSGDIVGLPNGLLYWTVSGSSTDLLVTVDPTSGATNLIGDTGYLDIWGLSYANSVLYGFTSGGQALEINATSAASTSIPIGGGWYGAATNPATWP